MADVMAHTGLGVDEIVAIHSAPTYTVYALGSHPGYCYLGGMDPRIATPRRKVPVLSIPGGAVSIGGSADRRIGIGRAERLEHDRHAPPCGSSIRTHDPPALFRARRQHPLPDRRGDPVIEIVDNRRARHRAGPRPRRRPAMGRRRAGAHGRSGAGRGQHPARQRRGRRRASRFRCSRSRRASRRTAPSRSPAPIAGLRSTICRCCHGGRKRARPVRF